jgi:hypothetical protein
MQTGVVAGFGEVIGPDRLSVFRKLGLSVIRQDLQTIGLRKPAVNAVIAECEEWKRAGGQALYITDKVTLPVVPDGSWVEYLNEPEYLSPEAYADQLDAIWPIVLSKKLTLWAGCIGNTDADSLLWLLTVLRNAPYLTHISVHRYTPGSDQSPTKPHKGFSTRDGEVRWLKDIIGMRPYIVSEVGFHTAWRRRFLFWRTRLSNSEQSMRLVRELDFWYLHGADAVCIYQENDAPGKVADKYGLRDETGAWKTSVIYGQPW